MTWLWVILIVAALAFVISYVNSGSGEEAASHAAGAGLGCGMVILQIFLSVLGIWLMFKLAQFLFS